jgi:hypothetical protein
LEFFGSFTEEIPRGARRRYPDIKRSVSPRQDAGENEAP